MKKHLLICINLIAGLLFLAACHSESMDFGSSSDKTGKLELNALSLTVDVKDIPLVPHGRVSAPSSAEKENYIINIYNSENEKLQTYVYKDMPEVVELPVGSYTLEAVSAARQESGFDKPYFRGSSSFDIKENIITSVSSVRCTLGNVQVSCTFSEQMTPYLGDDISVEMWFSEDDKVTLTPDETRECFLAAPKTEGNVLQVKLSGTVDGETISKQQAFSSVNAGTLQQVNFDVNIVRNGTVEISIQVDSSTTSSDETVTVKPEEPGIDDFDQGGTDPEEGTLSIVGKSYNGAAFDIDEVQTMQRGSEDFPVIVNIAASAGIQSLKVNISSTDSDFGAIGEQLGEFDMANLDAEKETMLIQLGLLQEGQQISGAKSVDFEITKAIHLLAMFTGTHKFAITVTDAAGNSLSKTLTINVE